MLDKELSSPPEESNTLVSDPVNSPSQKDSAEIGSSQTQETLFSFIAEQSCLGSFIQDYRNTSDYLISSLSEEHFYLSKHKVIYKALLFIAKTFQSIDLITLIDYLNQKKQMDAAGGLDYIMDLVTYSTSPKSIENYVQILQSKLEYRSLLKVLSNLQGKLLQNQSLDVDEILDQAETDILSIRSHRKYHQAVHLKNYVQDILANITVGKEDVPRVQISSRFQQLDRYIPMFHPGELIILAARPGMGKTALALNMLANMCLSKHNKNDILPASLFVSLEMSNEQLALRFLASQARVDLNKLIENSPQFIGVQNKKLEARDRQKNILDLMKVATLVDKSRIWLTDQPYLNYMDIKAIARRMKQKDGLDILFIDYLQLLSSTQGNNYNNRQYEVADISRNLKLLAKDLQIPIIALSQLSRESEKRSDKRPLLSDLRDSGAIEQDADIVMLLHRSDIYEQDRSKSDLMDTEIIIAKHRNGPVGIAKMVFYPHYTRFEDQDIGF